MTSEMHQASAAASQTVVAYEHLIEQAGGQAHNQIHQAAARRPSHEYMVSTIVACFIAEFSLFVKSCGCVTAKSVGIELRPMG